MTQPQSITIDVVSDVVCPWCYIGKKRLEQALDQIDDVEVSVHWRPYQLDPTIPPEGLDRKAYMLGKFGSEDKLREIHARVDDAGRDAGIAFDFKAITVSPNALDAHRVIRWAGNGGSGLQTAVNARIMKAYFEEGQNIGDQAVLSELAGQAGMDRSIVEALLPTDADIAETKAEIETAGRMGIRGVPCFLLESKYAVMGAQDAQALVDAIRQVAAAKARGELSTG